MGEVELGNTPKLGRRVAIYGGGNTAMDAAQDMIQKAHEEQLKAIAKLPAVTPKTDNTGSTTPTASTPKPQAPVLKPTKTVKAASLTIGKSYLESTTDVDAYLQKLRNELLKAINDGQRVRIE